MQTREQAALKICALALIAASGTVFAGPILGNYSTYTQLNADAATAISLDQITQIPTGASAAAAGTVYSNMAPGPNGFVAFAAGSGTLGFDDYNSINGGPILVDSIKFIGGASSALNSTLNFEFFDATGATLVNAFSITLGAAGNFQWTITLGAGFVIDNSGVMQISATAPNAGQWFLGNAGPTVGTENNMFGGTASGVFSHNFEINAVPAPGAMALLGLSGLIATRRRR